MKRIYSLLIFALICSFGRISAIATHYNVTAPNNAFAFSPTPLTINVGDTVIFTLGSIHGVNQVSKSVWDANGNTLLSGGFQIAVGALTGKWVSTTVDTFYYVCPPHVSLGMKGMIIVKANNASSIETLKYGKISLYPNPAVDFINLKLSLNSTSKVTIDLYDLTGRNVQNLMSAQVLEGDFNQSFEFDKRLPSGRYIVQVKCSNGSFAVPLIISGKR
jgi:plastocyanin